MTAADLYANRCRRRDGKPLDESSNDPLPFTGPPIIIL